MTRALTVKNIVTNKQDTRKTAFAIEYAADYDVMRAARACGVHPDTGRKWLNDTHVIECLNTIMHDRTERSHIDAEWLMHEMITNHHIARQNGNIAASNTALGMIGKLGMIDAFAADKLEVATGHDMVERLQRGRARMREHRGGALIEHGAEEVEAGVEGAYPPQREAHNHDAKISHSKNFTDFDKTHEYEQFDNNDAKIKKIDFS